MRVFVASAWPARLPRRAGMAAPGSGPSLRGVRPVIAARPARRWPALSRRVLSGVPFDFSRRVAATRAPRLPRAPGPRLGPLPGNLADRRLRCPALAATPCTPSAEMRTHLGATTVCGCRQGCAGRARGRHDRHGEALGHWCGGRGLQGEMVTAQRSAMLGGEPCPECRRRAATLSLRCSERA